MPDILAPVGPSQCEKPKRLTTQAGARDLRALRDLTNGFVGSKHGPMPGMDPAHEEP